MNKGKDAWGVQDEWENEAQTKKQNTLKTMLQSIKKTWHAKDDGTRYRPSNNIDIRTCYMC